MSTLTDRVLRTPFVCAALVVAVGCSAAGDGDGQGAGAAAGAAVGAHAGAHAGAHVGTRAADADALAAPAFGRGSAQSAPVAGSSDDERHAAALLARLVAARGVSGREGPVADAVTAELRRIDPRWQPQIDASGNVWLQFPVASVKAAADAPIAFIAHLDEIGLVVTGIHEDGLLECRSLGGFHDHLYRGTAIELVTASGAVLPGIALPAAPDNAANGAPAAGGTGSAVRTGGAAGAAPAEAFLVDVGARSPAQVAALGVAPGDTATVPKELLALGAHRVAGRSNDDRVGCAALLLALEGLAADGHGASLRRPVTFLWSTREEVGLEGADVAARTLRPVPAIVYAVDTFVSSDSPREDPRYAFAPLGAGPVLRALDNSSITPPAALAAVRTVASHHDIPLQLGTMGGGNDGSRFVPEGAIDCPLAWPQRNSHSRVETFDLRDLVQLSRLIEALVREG